MIQFPDIIISGGQTGVDRAALDVALKHKISCGGWCPRGRWAEDGPIPQKYPLKETKSVNTEERTKMNVKNSDGTLILTAGKEMDTGTIFTRKVCRKYNKPNLVLDLNIIDITTMTDFSSWIRDYNIIILNIAGPRESFSPGIYTKTYEFLSILFR